MMEKLKAGRVGLAYAAGAYLLWGLISIYFRATAFMPAPEVLAHRIVWSLAVTGIGTMVLVPWPEIGALLRDAGKLRGLLVSSVFLGANWLLFIWAVAGGQALEAGLGYFICPLLSVALGASLFGERMSRVQLAGLVIVVIGVVCTTLAFGRLPWIALSLAGTFAVYGLCRKTLKVPALLGLFAETMLLVPVAVAYLAWLEYSGGGHFLAADFDRQLLVAGLGVVTTVPLLLFAGATSRLRLTTLGLMQYLNPTVQCSLAVLAYGEPFTIIHAITFGSIWLGLAVFSLAPFLRRRQNKARMAEPVISLDN